MNQAITNTPADATFHIAFCVDNHYFRAMGATMASIVANNPQQHFTFHVLTFDAAPEHQARLKEMEQRFNVYTELHILQESDFSKFNHFIQHSHYSLSIFTRLVIPSVLKGIAKKVLYMDADILCVGRMDDLIAFDLNDHIIAGVPDAPVTTRRRVKALELKDGRYFNGGVLLIDVDRWEAEDCTGQTLQALLQHSDRMRFNDQDALNMVFDGRAAFLDIKWNYLYDLIHDLNINRTSMRQVGDAALIHFAGSVKPWAGWSDHAAVRLFNEYLQISPWSDLPLDLQPRNTKEMRMHSRFLLRQGKPLKSLLWYVRYLKLRSAKKRQSAKA